MNRFVRDSAFAYCDVEGVRFQVVVPDERPSAAAIAWRLRTDPVASDALAFHLPPPLRPAEERVITEALLDASTPWRGICVELLRHGRSRRSATALRAAFEQAVAESDLEAALVIAAVLLERGSPSAARRMARLARESTDGFLSRVISQLRAERMPPDAWPEDQLARLDASAEASLRSVALAVRVRRGDAAAWAALERDAARFDGTRAGGMALLHPLACVPSRRRRARMARRLYDRTRSLLLKTSLGSIDGFPAAERLKLARALACHANAAHRYAAAGLLARIGGRAALAVAQVALAAEVDDIVRARLAEAMTQLSAPGAGSASRRRGSPP